MKHKQLFCLLTAAAMLQGIPFTAAAADAPHISAVSASDSEGIPFKYALNTDETGYIIQEYTGSETSVTIPEEIEGLPVVSIGLSAFRGCDAVTDISIPETVYPSPGLRFLYSTRSLITVFSVPCAS